MVLPTTTPEQRRVYYEDVETLVVEGFLTHDLKVGGRHLCLRSLCPGDMFLLRHRARGVEDGWKIWLLASSIWMVDGVCLLDERHTAAKIAHRFYRISGYIHDLLLSVASGLALRQARAVEGAEAFCYEAYARQAWRSYGKQMPGLTVGVPGVERLGTNDAQRLWMAFNQMEDEQEQERIVWESAKLVASSNAPKAIQKLDRKDTQRKQEEAERRQRVMDRYFYYRKGLVDDEGRVKGDPNGGLVRGAHTVEELEDEMRRWVTGELDDHDRVVAEYKQRIIDRFERERRAAEQRRLAIEAALRQREEREWARPVKSPALVAYTAEQLAEIVGNRRRGVRDVGWGRAGERNYLYDKYLQQVPSAGNLAVEGDQVVEKGSLQDLVDQRAVPFRAEEG